MKKADSLLTVSTINVKQRKKIQLCQATDVMKKIMEKFWYHRIHQLFECFLQSMFHL